MSRGTEALVDPALLVWARKTSRLDVHQVAMKLGVSPEKLTAWESGTIRPTVNQLRKLAQIYKRPLAVFYLPEPPKTFDAMRDFRRLPGGDTRDVSPNLALAIRRALYRRDAALQLMQQFSDEGARFNLSIDMGSNYEHVAQALRDHIGIPLETQFRQKDKHQALNAWKNAVEELGILVFQSQNVPITEMRGISINHPVLPVVVLNGHDSPTGKTFSLIHELVHLLLHSGGICDLQEFGQSAQIESFCNRVAGAVLVPASSLMAERIVSQHTSMEWSDEELDALARRYWVSTEVIVRRLVAIGKASAAFYEAKRRQFVAIYEELRKAESEDETELRGYLPYYRIVLRNNGLRYTRLVLSAYHAETLSLSEVSDLLGVRLKHLPCIEHAVFSLPEGMF